MKYYLGCTFAVIQFALCQTLGSHKCGPWTVVLKLQHILLAVVPLHTSVKRKDACKTAILHVTSCGAVDKSDGYFSWRCFCIQILPVYVAGANQVLFFVKFIKHLVKHKTSWLVSGLSVKVQWIGCTWSPTWIFPIPRKVSSSRQRSMIFIERWLAPMLTGANVTAIQHVVQVCDFLIFPTWFSNLVTLSHFW